MKKLKKTQLVLAGGVLLAGAWAQTAVADDFKDGIAEVTDEPVASDDNLPKKTINLHYIIADAIAQAKKGAKAEDKAKTNINDGTTDSAENSIIIEPGSRIDKVINIVTEK